MCNLKWLDKKEGTPVAQTFCQNNHQKSDEDLFNELWEDYTHSLHIFKCCNKSAVKFRMSKKITDALSINHTLQDYRSVF